MKLSRTVFSRVAGQELDEKFECGLIRLLFKAPSHLLPIVPKDIGTPATRLVAEPTINVGAACASFLAPETDPSDEHFVLFAGKSTGKLDAQLFEALHHADMLGYFSNRRQVIGRTMRGA